MYTNVQKFRVGFNVFIFFIIHIFLPWLLTFDQKYSKTIQFLIIIRFEYRCAA